MNSHMSMYTLVDLIAWTFSSIVLNCQPIFKLCCNVYIIQTQLEHAETVHDLHQLLYSDEVDFRYECGVSQPVQTIRMADRYSIISAIALHCSVTMCKAELDQLVEGLRTLEVSIYTTGT